MKAHIRTDTVKVFDEQAKILDKMSKVKKINNKSVLYREALDFWNTHAEHMTNLLKKLDDISIQMHARDEALKEKMEDVYFKLDTIKNKQ